MKRPTLIHVLFVTALSVVLICPALARQGTKMDPNAKTITIEGAVRDLACPIQNPAGGATSFSLKCTLDCVKQGPRFGASGAFRIEREVSSQILNFRNRIVLDKANLREQEIRPGKRGLVKDCFARLCSARRASRSNTAPSPNKSRRWDRQG